MKISSTTQEDFQHPFVILTFSILVIFSKISCNILKIVKFNDSKFFRFPLLILAFLRTCNFPRKSLVQLDRIFKDPFVILASPRLVIFPKIYRITVKNFQTPVFNKLTRENFQIPVFHTNFRGTFNFFRKNTSLIEESYQTQFSY